MRGGRQVTSRLPGLGGETKEKPPCVSSGPLLGAAGSVHARVRPGLRAPQPRGNGLRGEVTDGLTTQAPEPTGAVLQGPAVPLGELGHMELLTLSLPNGQM